MKPRDHDFVRLKHMLESVQAIQEYTQGRTRADLDSNRLLTAAIIRELQILGEAANTISEETARYFKDIPWRAMIGMRNRLIHAYFEINHDIVWNTIVEAIPNLCTQLKAAILAFQESGQT